VGKPVDWPMRADEKLTPEKIKEDRRAAKLAEQRPAGMIDRFYRAEADARAADKLLNKYGPYAYVPSEAFPDPSEAGAAARRQEGYAAALANADYDAAVADARLRGATIPPRPARIAIAPSPIPNFKDFYNQAQDRMLDTGFTLTYSYCSDFFLSQGKRQTLLLTLRDAIATAGTLATGALALANFQNTATQSTVLAVVGLSTAGATAGIDIYTQRFLFGAENVDAVRDLTLQALNVHQNEIHKKVDFVYDDVVKALLDNQAICTPRHIALLARHAIANAVIEGVTPSASQGELEAQADRAKIARLSANLGFTSALDDNQLLILWWLSHDPTVAESKNERSKFPTLPKKEPTLATKNILESLTAAQQAAWLQKAALARLEARQAEFDKMNAADQKKNAKKLAETRDSADKATAEATRIKPAGVPVAVPNPASTVAQPDYSPRPQVDVARAKPQ